MKIIFMGTPDFAKESLEAIYNAGHQIEAVVTNPDRPKGRGMKLVESPVKQYAIEKELKIYQPERVRKNAEFIEEMKRIKPDVICVVAYGKILPKEILEIPDKGCINVHGSLLPKYRGSAPIQWAVINGEAETGVTTMYMDIGMDTGDMILKEKTQIGENETTGDLWERLSKIGAKLLVKTLEQIENGTAPRVPQGNDFTMAPMLNKEMSKIDWETRNAKQIKDLIRGLNPIMGTYSYINSKKVKFWKAETVNKLPEERKIENYENGTVIYSNSKNGLYIKAKEGIIKIIEIQGENSKRMDIKEYLIGNEIVEGTKLK